MDIIENDATSLSRQIMYKAKSIVDSIGTQIHQQSFKNEETPFTELKTVRNQEFQRIVSVEIYSYVGCVARYRYSDLFKSSQLIRLSDLCIDLKHPYIAIVLE